MYSTCVSAWRVPLMNVTDERIGHAPRPPTISSAPRPFWTVIIVASGQWPARRSARSATSVPLLQTSTRPGSGSAVGSTEAVDLRVKVGAARHAQALLVQRARVRLAAGEDGDVGDLGEMPGEEAADHAGAGDADPLAHACTTPSGNGESFSAPASVMRKLSSTRRPPPPSQ